MMQAPKTLEEVDQRIAGRLFWAEIAGSNIFDREDGEFGLFRGDVIETRGYFKGWTPRELYPPFYEVARDHGKYLRAYWLHEWNGTYNQAREAMRDRTHDFLEGMGVPKRHRRRAAWGDFTLETKSDREVFDRVKSFTPNGIQDRRDVLALVGKPGTRKTQLAVMWLWYIRMNNEPTACFVPAADLAAGIRDPDKLEMYTTTGALVIDDVGADPDDVDAVIKVIGARIDNELQTAYTSNAWPEQISEIYGPRGHSRMINSAEVVTFEGRDWRLPKPN